MVMCREENENRQSGTSPDHPKNLGLGGVWERKAVPDQAREAQDRSKSGHGVPKKAPRDAKSRPRAFTSRPSDAKEPPKRGPDSSRAGVHALQVEF